MEQSILISTKKLLHVASDDDSFDLDIMTHINSAFSTLHDLGIGPLMGFVIEDETAKWDDIFDNPEEHKVTLSWIRTYVFLKGRLLFDPPTTSFLLDAVNKQIQELEWRINAKREETDWVDPLPFEHTIIDGGDPVSPHFADG